MTSHLFLSMPELKARDLHDPTPNLLSGSAQAARS